MEALYIILLIVVIILLISNQNSLNKKIGELEFLIVNLQTLVKKLGEARPHSRPFVFKLQ